MEHLDEMEIHRLKELMGHISDFIAYFEHAESKMMQWRQDIEQQATAQKKQFAKQSYELNEKLQSLNDISQVFNAEHSNLLADQLLNQRQEELNALHQIEQSAQNHIRSCQQQFATLCQEALDKIDHQTTLAVEKIERQLSVYDAQQFYRIANESSEQVEKSARNAIARSNRILHLFQWRMAAFAFLTALATAFAIGLYLSDEFPWEIHQQAMSEREAGKMLINAWPKLSYQEKIKIIGEPQNSQE